MHPSHFDSIPPRPEINTSDSVIEVAGHASIAAGASLRDAFAAALTALGQDLQKRGAAPAFIRTLTVRVPDPGAFMDDIVELDLLYRELLGGNSGDVALLTSDTGVTVEALLVVPAPSTIPVYAGMTAAEVGREYSPRATVPEAPAIMARWREDGRVFQASRAAEVQYGAGPKHAIDLFMPKDVARPPLMVFIHGGYWQALDKRDNGHLCAGLLGEAVAVAAVNYPLCPPATIAEIIKDCRTAVATLYQTAGSHGYDPDRITVCGHSAGGHLAAILGSTDWPSIDGDLPNDLIKGCLPISGVFDLEPLIHTGINAALGLDKAAAKAASATALMNNLFTGPVLCAVGGDESKSFRKQSRNYTDLARKSGARADYLELPGKNHFTVLEALNDQTSPLFRAAVRIAKGQGQSA